MLLAPRILRGHFFLTIFFRVTHDGLSERGTTRSLDFRRSLGSDGVPALEGCARAHFPKSLPVIIELIFDIAAVNLFITYVQSKMELASLILLRNP